VMRRTTEGAAIADSLQIVAAGAEQATPIPLIDKEIGVIDAS